MIEKLHLIDGTFELFRFYYSKRPEHAAKNGQPVKATMGMIEGLISLLESKEEAVTHLAVAFDNPIRSFRNDLFDGYKTEQGVAPDLLAQFDLAEDGVRALGITVWSMKDFEADDGLATGAARFRDYVSQVRILSPDKDLCQCVTEETVVLVDRIRKKVIDEPAVFEKFGIGPKAIPEFLGLVGDEADGIPGLSGFGQKTAAVLLSTFGSVASIPDDSRLWPKSVRGAPRLAATLAASRNEVSLYTKLATLVTDAPVTQELEVLRYRGAPPELLSEFSERIGSKRIAERVGSLRPR
ncbi:MAG: flap endonuclease [Deltaproteobacteria bacterium]|nr:flap endonuclease [Deltaproteobacteria bacterium]